DRKYPDDLDAATLYAESAMDLRPWQLWSADGKPAEGTEEIVAVLESVLRRDPNHAGAIHYYIHTVEASPNPERALVYAPRLGQLAAAADEAYLKASGVQGIYPLMYYSHNLHFLAIANCVRGRYADAMKAATQL